MDAQPAISLLECDVDAGRVPHRVRRVGRRAGARAGPAPRVRARGGRPHGAAAADGVPALRAAPAHGAVADAAAVEGHGRLGVRGLDERAHAVAHGAAAAVQPDLGQVAELGPQLLDLREREVLVLGLRNVRLAWQQRARRLHVVPGSVEEEVVRQAVVKTSAKVCSLHGSDELLGRGLRRRHVVPVGIAVRQRRGRLPRQEAAAVLGRQHGRGRAERLEGLDPVRDVEVRRSEGVHVAAVAAAVGVAAEPVAPVAPGVSVVEEGGPAGVAGFGSGMRRVGARLGVELTCRSG